MQAGRALIIALFALFLSGCDFITPPPPSAAALAAQAEAEAHGERLAELTYLNRQAGVYNGCRWLVNICPNSVTDLGREAIEGNHVGGGGDSLIYWLIIIFKLIGLGLAAGAAWVTARVGWNRLVLPSQERLEQARKEVQTAKNQAARIIDDARHSAARAAEEAQAERTRLIGNLETDRERLTTEISNLESLKTELERQNATLEAHARKATERVDTLSQEVKRLEAAARASSFFD